MTSNFILSNGVPVVSTTIIFIPMSYSTKVRQPNPADRQMIMVQQRI